MRAENVLMGKRITEARNRRSWTKADLARRAHVVPSYITRIEQGKFDSPSIDKVRSIADALGLSVAALTDPPVPASQAVGLQAEIEALGFRPDEAPDVAEIVQAIAEDAADERRETIDVLRGFLKVRARRQMRTVR